MYQFYFLSVFVNLLAGLTLSADYLFEKFNALMPVKEFLGKKGFKITLGVFALVVGFLKLLILSRDNDVPVVGDLLPALAGLAMGAALLFELFKERTNVPAKTVNGLEKVVVTYKVPLGLSGIGISLLHFLIPGALFL